MFRAVTNLLFRGQDSTRDWVFDPSRLIVDVELCTLCGGAVGGKLATFAALGPSEDAGSSVRGLPQWVSRGIYCSVSNDRVSDFTIDLAPSREARAFPGRFVRAGRPLEISPQTTVEQLREALGEPFAQASDEGDVVVFYEYGVGEAQFTFSRQRGTLEALECWYEPELSDKAALESYRIDKPFPDAFRRRLLEARF